MIDHDAQCEDPGRYGYQCYCDTRALVREIERLRGLLRRVRRAGIKCSETIGPEWDSAMSELFELIHGAEMSAALGAADQQDSEHG